MSRYTDTPSHLGRKVIGVAILLVLAVIIAIGILQKTTSGPSSQNDTPSTAVTSTIVSPPSALPAPPAPPAVVSSCHKPIDATPPVTSEQDFIDLVWEYESAYLSADAVQWETVLQKATTARYHDENQRHVDTSSSTLTTTVIPDGSVITWKDNDTKTERTVSTVACILIMDSEQAATLPYSVPAHYTTWVMTESGWRLDHDTH